MKIPRYRPWLPVALCALLAAPGGGARAATLTFDAPAYLEPDAAAEVVTTLPSGTSVTPLVRDELKAEGIETPPKGWVVIRFPGPVYGYVLDADIGKDLNARPGSVVRIAPANDATILTMINETDRAEMAGPPEGQWARVVLRKEMLLYLNNVPPGSRGQQTVADPERAGVEAAARETEPATAAAVAEAAPAEVAPAADPSEAAPRVFEGTFSRTRRIFGAGPKLDYQLLDENNRRIALLDLSALLLTEPLDYYEGQVVSVFGTGTSQAGVKELIIRVETMRRLR